MRYLVILKNSAWQQAVFAENKRQARKQILPWVRCIGDEIEDIIEF